MNEMHLQQLSLIPTPSATEGPLTMSSKEIAELTGKEHKHVMRDIRAMLEALGQTSDQFWTDVPDSYGRPQPAFALPKDLTLTLVAGYNVTLRHRIVTRWMELEAQVVKPQVPALADFTDPAEAARARDNQRQQPQEPRQNRTGCIARTPSTRPSARSNEPTERPQDAFLRLSISYPL